MLEYLYLVFIAPLEYIMRAALEWAVDASGSYGLSIIVMSLVVNVMLLPLYHMAEQWQEDERYVQKCMEKQLARIKRFFTGKERYMLTQTLYRQHGYHPIYAVRTSFGFLIQVPFFFAAYHFLSSYEPLTGVSFWLFDDLAKPDGLIRIGGMGINVLPVVMTAINIVSSLVYTARLSRKDKIQLYSMAVFFLVLLYGAPAGLVFYWTCNNIFSLGKNIVYEHFHIFSHEEKKSERDALLAGAGFFERAKSPVLLASAVVLSVVLIKLLHLVTKRGFLPGSADMVLPALTAAVFLVFVYFFILLWSFVQKRKLSCTFFWGVVLLSCSVIFFWGHNYRNIIRLLVGHILLLGLLWENRFTVKIFDAFRVQGARGTKSLFVPALTVTALLVFVYVPSKIFAADASLFTPYAAAILTWGVALTISIPCLLYRNAFKEFREVLTVACCAVALLASLYVFFLVRDYGVLDSFIFEHEDRIRQKWYVYVDIVAVLVAASISSYLFFRKTAALKKLLSLLIVIIVCLSGANYARIGTQSTDTSADMQSHQQTYIRLSSKQPNVLVIMLDMFTGDHIANMMKDRPELLEEFDGFTWYPDTISAASATSMSLPSIIAGEKVASYRLLEDDGVSLEDKIDREIRTFFDFLKSRGYSTNITVTDQIDFISKQDYVTYSIWRKFFRKLVSPKREHQELMSGIFAVSYGLFEAAPWSLRYKIYRKGDWFFATKNNDSQLTMKNYSVLNALPEITSIDEGGAAYHFFINDLPHIPWSISGETLRPMEGDPFPETVGILGLRNGLIPEHYFAEMASLKLVGEFLDYLKQNGAYDNSLVVVVSDHCEGDSPVLAKVFGHPKPEKALQSYPGRPNALLLIKDFNARGPLRVSEALMSTTDVRTVIEKAVLNETMPIPADGRARYHLLGSWQRERHAKNFYKPEAVWKITGSKMKRENWTQIK